MEDEEDEEEDEEDDDDMEVSRPHRLSRRVKLGLSLLLVPFLASPSLLT